MSDTDLKEKEEQGAVAANDQAASVEGDKLGKGYTSKREQKEKKNFLSRLTGRQKGVIFIILALAGSGGVGIFTILQGPFQFIHFGQVLAKHFIDINNVMDDQQLARVRYKKRLGTVANKAADIVEGKLNKAGYTSRYNDAGSFTGFSIDPQKVDINELKNFGADINIDTKTGEFLLTENGANFKRRRLITGVLKHADLDLIPTRISSRLLRKRGNTSFKIFGNLDRRAYETTKDFQDALVKKFTEYYKNGVPFRARATADENKKEDGSDLTEEEKAQRRKDAADFQGSLDEISTDPSDINIEKLGDEVEVGGKTGGEKASDLLGFACAARAVGAAYQLTLYARIVLPLTRLGISYMSMGSQVMANKASLDELGAFNKFMYNKTDGTSWASARSIQYELGQNLTGPDMPAVSKPSRIGNKPAFFQTMDALPLKTACKVNDSTLGGIGISIVTGGIVSNLIFEALSKAGIDPVGKLIQGAISLAVGKPLKDLPSGAVLGNYANYGSLFGSMDQTIAMGGSVLSDTDAAILKNERLQVEQETYAHLPLKDKLFDIYEPHSLISQAMFRAPPELSSGNMATMFATLLRSPTNIFSAFSYKKAFAAESYDYGVDTFGFSRSDQDNPKFADPYAVEANVESGTRLKDLNDKYGHCFSTTVDPDTKQIKSGQPVNYYDDKYQDCRKKSSDSDYEDFTYFRFYLLGKVTERSLECYGGYDESCDQVGYGAGGPDQQQDTVPNTTSSGVVGNMGESSDSVACADGTKDLGVVDSKYRGDAKTQPGTLKIRLCQIPSIPGYGENTKGEKISGGAVVNSRVSGSWFALGNQANQSGASLRANSSFRLNDSCGGTGNGTACASPGKSYHQLGVAIDFEGIHAKGTSTSSCSTRAKEPNNPDWVWLYKNAETFGFRQYTYEAWHWDPVNNQTRCGTNQ